MSQPSSSTTKEYEIQLEQYKQVRQYLLSCNTVPLDCDAMQVSLKALEKATKQTIRDEKLRQKFAKQQNNNTTTSTTSMEDDEDDWLTITSPPKECSPANNTTNSNDEDALILDTNSIIQSEESSSSLLGRTLAKDSIQMISDANICVWNPFEGIAVLLHVTLLKLQFKCTTSQETKLGGFAPPIRELPQGQILPPNWNDTSSSSSSDKQKITFWYRKQNRTMLSIELEQDDVMNVFFGDTVEQPCMTFPLDHYFNSTSFQTAKNKNNQTKISPLLHYKSVSTLLTKFTSSIDCMGDPSMGDIPNYATHPLPPTSNTTTNTNTNTTHLPPLYHNPPSIMINNDRRKMGDFHTDLFGTRPDISSGNLMGPNHSIFAPRHDDSDVGGFGDHNMQPRFDPIYPPGVGPGIGRNRNKQKKRPKGELNPDHLRPPSNLGDHMFM